MNVVQDKLGIMHTAVYMLIDLAPFVLASWWPFVRVMRGRSVLGSLFLCWGLLIFWHVTLFLVFPMLLYRGMRCDISDWIPEGPVIFATAIMFGWFPAAATVFVADWVHHFVSKRKSPNHI